MEFQMADKTMTLTDNATGKSIELPVMAGSVGPEVIDIRSVYKELGMFTYDPGFASTAACSSDITYIDGDKGTLLYRGYPIEELAEHSSYLEASYLLWYGTLPNAEQYEEFVDKVKRHTMIHEGLKDFYAGFHRDAHPMAIMVGIVGSLSAFYHDSLDVWDARHREISAYRVFAKLPTIAAWAYRYSQGQPFVYPRNDLDHSENFLHMMFAFPSEEYKVSPVAKRALDLILMLHADHEQNASTSTVRLAGSTLANPFAVISAGVAALWGPSHGGASEAVVNMLETIGTVDQIPKYIEKAQDKDDTFRLMGFGHRVYKNFDPRAKLIRTACYEVLEELQVEDPMFDLAMALEERALKDEYFIKRKLYPNVDFYSGVIFRALGIPKNMFTVIFTIGRSIGWLSHWNEMLQDDEFRIGRPRQRYIGPASRPYVPIEKR
jgi:citrate synthase